MKFLILLICPILLAFADANLLEMSQILWSKLLNGSLSAVSLDPLLVPVVKIDQSQGNIRYRMMLNDVEVLGLNESTIESVHVGRGSLKSNLSEREAGYVSYNDAGHLDAIRYRFHTVVKEPKVSEDLRVEENQRMEFVRPQEFNERNPEHRRRFQEVQEMDRRYRGQESGQQRLQESRRMNERYRNENVQESLDDSRRNGFERTSGAGVEGNQRDRSGESHFEGHERFQQVQGTNQRVNHQNNYRNDQFLGRGEYVNDNQRHQLNPGVKSAQRFSSFEESVRKRNYGNHQSFGNQNANVNDCRENQNGCNYGPVQESGVKGSRRNYENFGAESVNVESRMRFSSKIQPQDQFEGNRARVRYPNGERIVYAQIPGSPKVEVAGKFESGEFSERLEKRPGFVDIVYVDKGSNGDRKVKHFGNLRVEEGKDTNVYGLEDVVKDLDDHRRFIIHNFTEGESLMKKNNLTRANYEMRRIKDFIRYAKNHQEKEGYFEEGMELIYHYGNNASTMESKRSKRAHEEEDNDDDIMHVIVRIRVPLLRVKAGYVLMGKVGEQVLLGDGRLDGNFTNLVGDFTVELKKNNDSMVVRAARARLEATDKNVRLEGMNEKGPVEEILNQGLMAAEAVAAMLADDLATKALNEKTSDSIIYKMYRELPE